VPRTLPRRLHQHPAGPEALTLESVQGVRWFKLYKNGKGPFWGEIKSIFNKDGDTIVSYVLEGETKYRPAYLLGLEPCPDGEWHTTHITRR
jgi:hypothetical protein